MKPQAKPQKRTPRQKRREVAHWSVVTYAKPAVDHDGLDFKWGVWPYRWQDIPNFTPYACLPLDEFDRKLHTDLPALLHWLAARYPTTAEWPVFFEDGAPHVECGRTIIK